MDRPTFSMSWSRVSRLTPTLRPQVQMHRQLYHGEPWHILNDPVTNNFFRLNPVAHHLVGLLDGRRSIDEVWRLTLERFGDAAPTQNEVIGLLGQLNESNLLRVDLPADAAPLLKRQQRRRIRQIGGQFLSILSLKFPLFNPDRFVTWLQPVFRPFLSRFGLVLWLLWVVGCFVYFIPNISGFLNNVDSVLDPNNWLWMMVIFLGIKSWHELGHAMVCKRFGGAVPEVGVMLLVLLPAPYVDATSSWNFPSKWHRLLVGAAGMMFELVIAGVAVVVWLNTEAHTLPKQLAYNTIFLASITTILFNANPLLRFDGYYMLSDLTEVPNLYERAGRQLRWIAQRYLFGMTNVPPTSTIFFEQVFLVVYGIASQIYRVVVMFGISLFVATQIPTLGLIIGVWAVIAWAAIPAVKFIHWLIAGPSLHEHRFRAVTVSLLLFAAAVVGLGVIPAPDHRRADGVIESAQRADLAVDSDGFVTEVNVEAGQRVKIGEVLLVAENPTLLSRQKELQAQLEGLRLAQRQTLAKEPLAAQMNLPRIAAVEESLADVTARLKSLTVIAPQDGVIVGGFLQQLKGQYLKRGQVFAHIDDPADLRVTAMVDQAHATSPFLGGIKDVELRTAGRIPQVIHGTVLHQFDGGRTELPHRSLGYAAGGSIPTDPQDSKGMRTLRPQFELWIAVDQDRNHPQAVFPGERVHVRLTLTDTRPLGLQWIHRLRQVIRERLLV
ncbi:MAG: PqqD family peptide modification chaperone [Planctomycetota bacterium]|nr:PqqD family peptide modification chaperone [Planctomycetota bacterium]